MARVDQVVRARLLTRPEPWWVTGATSRLSEEMMLVRTDGGAACTSFPAWIHALALRAIGRDEQPSQCEALCALRITCSGLWEWHAGDLVSKRALVTISKSC